MKQTIIGRAERIEIIGHSSAAVPAKVDTGADLSSIWASDIFKDSNDVLWFYLFAPGSVYYTGQRCQLPASDYRLTRVANSFGHKELRYVVKLPIRVCGRRLRASFTLADRSNKLYPILLGRRLLHNKFLVDVARGQPLRSAEARKRKKLQIELADMQG